MASAAGNFKERDLGGIVDELFRVYLRNFLPFVGIVAVAGIPLAIIGAAVGWYALSHLLDTADLTILFLLIAVLVIASILAYLLMSAAVTYAVAVHY